jgi:hypothetical protein
MVVAGSATAREGMKNERMKAINNGASWQRGKFRFTGMDLEVGMVKAEIKFESGKRTSLAARGTKAILFFEVLGPPHCG